MVSGTRCPSVCVCSDVVNGGGAAAPEGQMIYDSTQDDFLRFLNSEGQDLGLRGLISGQSGLI